MGVVQKLFDGLTNAMSGRGTSIDRRTGNLWLWMPVTPDQVEAAYRTNWLVRKVVDIPAKDMTREGRAWQTDKDKIEKLEAEEKRLGLWPKLLRVLILARLYGGGALYLSTGDANTSLPLNPDRIGKGGLRFIHVLNRHEMSTGPKITDPESEWYGKPEYFQISTTSAAYQGVRIHPSRMICFMGQPQPEGVRFTQSDDWFWGDPILQSINDAVQDAMTATGGFASLIDEAKVDVIKTPGLMDLVGTAEGEARVVARMAAASLGKSNHRALILDGSEEWEHRQITWAGMPDIISAYLNIVAGAADIPVTRLLGQSPKGLQSTGKGEQADYHDKVEADQGEYLRPQLDQIDAALIRSALGTVPSDIYWEFNPLDTPDEGKESEIDKRVADTLKVYSDMGIIQEEALADIAKNRMIESNRWPGCEKAFEEHPDVPEDTAEPDPAEVETAAEVAAAKVETMRTRKAVNDDQAVALITDARPRTLYVKRQLLNADEFLNWAKAQGFEATLEPGDLHVTVCFSRQELDWLKVDSAWDGEDGKLVVPPGGARLVEALGDKGAVTLLFNSSPLSWRHEQIIRAGASHDFDDYQPHVTITYALPEGMRVEDVEPYRGKLVFGPEIFEEIDPDWTPKMTGVGEGAGVPFDDGKARRAHYAARKGFDPNQPRDLNGQWVDTGARGFIEASAQDHPRADAHVLGKVSELAARRAKANGLSIGGKDIALDAGGTRHTLNRHGPLSGDPRPIAGHEIASAHIILNRAKRFDPVKASATGAKRFEVEARLKGRTYIALFEIRRKSVSLVTLRRGK